MIPVAKAREPRSFEAHVRQRGKAAIARLLGQKVTGRGRRPSKVYTRPEKIPAKKFPTYWTEVRGSDGKSTLDDMMDVYEQRCAYLAMRIERATGNPTVDHYVAKELDWRLVYEWSNYRLSAGCVNGAKGIKAVVDPFTVGLGWFELDLGTFFVLRGAAAPAAEQRRIDDTLPILNLRQCVAQRGEYITDYRNGHIDLRNVERYAPFIASELRRQGKLLRGDV